MNNIHTEHSWHWTLIKSWSIDSVSIQICWYSNDVGAVNCICNTVITTVGSILYHRQLHCIVENKERKSYWSEFSVTVCILYHIIWYHVLFLFRDIFKKTKKQVCRLYIISFLNDFCAAYFNSSVKLIYTNQNDQKYRKRAQNYACIS